MFCPRCGQEQVSEEIRYCSKCGFSFEIVAQILAYSGSLPQFANVYNKQKDWFTRSNGWKLGLVWFLFFTFVLAPFLAIAGVDAIPELSLIVGFIGGLLITLYCFIFLKNAPEKRNPEQLDALQKTKEYDVLHGKTSQNVLPPQESLPNSAYIPPISLWNAPTTNDLSSPVSVTDSTTKLLEKDE